MPLGQGGLDRVEHRMNLIFGDDQRRAEGNRITKRTQDHTMFKAFGRNGFARSTIGIKRCFRTLIRNQFKRPDQAVAPGFADMIELV